MLKGHPRDPWAPYGPLGRLDLKGPHVFSGNCGWVALTRDWDVLPAYTSSGWALLRQTRSQYLPFMWWGIRVENMGHPNWPDLNMDANYRSLAQVASRPSGYREPDG